MTQYISPLLTLVVSAVSIAAMWGVLKATVESLKGEVNRLREATDENKETFTSFREEVRVALAVMNAEPSEQRHPRRASR